MAAHFADSCQSRERSVDWAGLGAVRSSRAQIENGFTGPLACFGELERVGRRPTSRRARSPRRGCVCGPKFSGAALSVVVGTQFSSLWPMIRFQKDRAANLTQVDPMLAHV